MNYRGAPVYFLCFIALFLLLVFIFSSVSSAADALTVRVGLYENRPKIFSDVQGRVQGFWPDIINYMASKEGWRIEYKQGSWTDCLDRLANNEIDMMPDVAYTEDRNNLYDFSREAVYTSWSRVYTRQGTGIQSIIDLEKKSVAVLKGSVNVEGPDGIKRLASAFNINCTFNEVESYDRVFELVKNGSADAGVASKDFGYQNNAKYNLVETSIIFQPSHLYFAFPKNSGLSTILISRVDQEVKSLKDTNDSVYYQSLNRWMAEQPVTTAVIPRWVVWTISGIIGLVLVLGAGSLIMRARIKSRTKELTAEINMRKKAETDLHKYQANLEGLIKTRTGELEQANLHKSQFLANMSHELRTPLNSILGYTKLMLDGVDGAVTIDQKDDLQTVYDNSKHLLSLINDLLDLSKIEAGKFEVIKTEFPVSDLMAKIIPSMDKLAKDKGLALVYTVAPGLEKLYADKNKTVQVLFNLLGNAIKFTRSGSIHLKISENEKEVLLSVTDTGVGIEKGDIDALFKSYKQVGPARLDGSEGTGLGLVISKQFVEMQGGKIWVESEPGKGSTFFFTLPKK